MRSEWVAAAISALLAAQPSLASAAEWIDTARSGSLTYFLFAYPAEIARFDGDTGQWLARIPLASTPSAIAVDAEAIFVAFGAAVSRIPLAGGPSIPLGTMPAPVVDLAAGDTALIVIAPAINDQGVLWNLDKHGAGIIGARNSLSPLRGASLDPAGDRIYLRDSGRSPPDILAAPLDTAGQIGELFDSPHHGDLPSATRTFPFPSGGSVIDDSGTIYRGRDLVETASLAGAFDAIAFDGDSPVVLRDAQLARYSASFAPLGVLDLGSPGDELAIAGDELIVFRSLGNGRIDAASVALDALVPPIAPMPPQPRGLMYEPDEIVASDDGAIFLLSKSNRAVFRWSLAARGYLSPIGVYEAPDHIVWQDAVDRLFLGYPSGRISRIRLGANESEEHFANSPKGVQCLGQAEGYLMVCDYAGAWAAHYTYDARTARRTAWTGWNHIVPEIVWNAPLRRAFFTAFYGSYLAYESMDASGALSAVQRGFASNGYAPNGAPVRIRQNPAGSIAALGDGQIHDLSSLAVIGELPRGFEDAAWVGPELFAVTGVGSMSLLEEWDPYRQLVRSASVPGNAPRIFAFGPQLVIVTQWSGRPRFVVLTPAPEDLDGDGVLDGADAFPADSDEISDRDHDGVGDHSDAFPDDPTETLDSDGDGVGDNTDDFPTDPGESNDADGDGVGDAGDVFPNDPAETSDRDDDGIGDNADAFPDLVSGGDAQLAIDQRMKVTGYGRFGGGGPAELHFLPEDTFALCSEGECDFGRVLAKGKKNASWTLVWSPDALAVLAEVLEEVVEEIVGNETGELVDLELDASSARVKSTAKLARSGKELRMTLTVKLSGLDVVRGKKVKLSYALKATGPFSRPP